MKPVYLSTSLPGRRSVREPIPAPRMEFMTGVGRRFIAELTEAQLLAVLADVTKTLNAMRLCRHATQPKETDQ